MDQLRYFVFNKKKDYESGYRKDIRITKQGLALEEGAEDSGIFISRLLDSGEEGNQWHRAVIESEGYGDDSIRFYFYCRDDFQVSAEGRTCPWEEVIENREISPEKKHRMMEPFLVHVAANPQDIMLYHARGRYLWMEIQLFCQAGFLPEIHHMKLYAGNRSFLSYRPMIYQTGGREDFLGRFLGMFEAVYQDLEERIAGSARQLDPMAADPEFLRWLAKWVGISNGHLWQEERLRLLLEGIVKKNLIRGTREYMEDGITGYVCHSNSPEEYGELIRQMKEEPDRRREMSIFCRSRAREFDLERTDGIMRQVHGEMK